MAWAAPRAAQARDCKTLQSFPDQTMGLHVQGGIQGRNDWYVVDLTNGHVCVRRRGESDVETTLTAAQLSALKKEVAHSGFFEWDAEYVPTNKPADAMTTQIVYNDGRKHQVVTRADPVEAPPGFFALVRRFELLGFSLYWHSANYLYVTGRLEHQSLEGGFWTVVYASDASQVAQDKYGGKLVLEVDRKMLSGFRSGDLVFLKGTPDLDRMGIQMAGTYYKVQSIEHLR